MGELGLPHEMVGIDWSQDLMDLIELGWISSVLRRTWLGDMMRICGNDRYKVIQCMSTCCIKLVPGWGLIHPGLSALLTMLQGEGVGGMILPGSITGNGGFQWDMHVEGITNKGKIPQVMDGLGRGVSMGEFRYNEVNARGDLVMVIGWFRCLPGVQQVQVMMTNDRCEGRLINMCGSKALG